MHPTLTQHCDKKRATKRFALPQKSRLIHTGLQPGVKHTGGELENRFNGFSCGSSKRLVIFVMFRGSLHFYRHEHTSSKNTNFGQMSFLGKAS